MRTKKYLFPQNYQQDDISELRVSFYEDFICALNMGDNHPLLTSKIWIISKIFKEPEYVISIFIIFVTIVSFVLIFKIFKDHFNLEIAIFVFTILLFSSSIINYSISLKQYSFELLASSYSFRSLQLYLNDEFKYDLKIRYILFSTLLVLFSFVNIVPFVLTLLFVFISSRKVKIQYILVPALFYSLFTIFCK